MVYISTINSFIFFNRKIIGGTAHGLLVDQQSQGLEIWILMDLLLQFWTIRNSPWITGIGSEDIFILLTLCSSEIHLFYNLQLFYWHFLEILWLFIFQLFYNYFFHLLKPLDWWMCFYILQALWSGSWLVEENISWRLGGQQVLDFWNFLSSPNHLGHAL